MPTEQKEVYSFQPTLSPTTAKLIDALRAVQGDTITDEELMAVCGKDTRSNRPGYGNLTTAIRRIRREDSIVWARVRGANALRRLDGNGIDNTLNASLKHIRKMGRTAVEKSGCVKASDLEGEELSSFLAKQAILGTMILMGRTQTIKQLAARKIDNAMLAPALLEAFKKI